MQPIGVLGGTFDPPHIAHLVLASEAQAQLDLQRVLWVLTPDPPHKPDQVISPVAIRREMVEAAIRDNPLFELSTVDIDRPAPHYAAETLSLLQAEYPRTPLVYLMGEDSLRDLPSWHQPEVFLQRCDYLGIMRRPDVLTDLAGLNLVIPGIQEKVRFIDVPLLQISSTDIRLRAARAEPFRYFLPEEVYRLIRKKQLYRAD